MQPLRWLDTGQRRLLSSCAGQDTAGASQLMDCDFPNPKDNLEGLAGHVGETMPPPFYFYTAVQAVTTNHTNDLRQPRGRLLQEIALEGGKSPSRSPAQQESLFLSSHR